MPRPNSQKFDIPKDGESLDFLRFERGKKTAAQTGLFFVNILSWRAAFIALEGADQSAGIAIASQLGSLPNGFSLLQKLLGGLQAHSVQEKKKPVVCQVLVLMAQGGEISVQPVGNEGNV